MFLTLEMTAHILALWSGCYAGSEDKDGRRRQHNDQACQQEQCLRQGNLWRRQQQCLVRDHPQQWSPGAREARQGKPGEWFSLVIGSLRQLSPKSTTSSVIRRQLLIRMGRETRIHDIGRPTLVRATQGVCCRLPGQSIRPFVPRVSRELFVFD